MEPSRQGTVPLYDAIVVGARCAGAPTAMLLARHGRRVLLVDRSLFPSDHLSSHFVQPSGVSRLRDWGLLDQVVATGCPAMEDMTLDFGPFALRGRPLPLDGLSAHYAPRRVVLDDVLVRAAAAAGAELLEGVRVRELLWEDGRVVGIRAVDRGGAAIDVRTRVVIGADGMRSTVARAVAAPVEHAHPPVSCAYYGYWHEVEAAGIALHARPGGMVAEFQTHDGATVVYAAWPQSRFEEVRANVAGAFAQHVDAIAPELGQRLRRGFRNEPIRGSGTLENFLRRSAGPGWALAGDAAAHKDPYLASGISDAMRDAEMLAAATHAGLDGDLDAELEEYHRERTAALRPLYDLNLQLAGLEPPPARLAEYLASMVGDAKATARFLGAISGTVPLDAVMPGPVPAPTA